ncbi:MAG: preprotein translocase subunit SecA, partial [Pseudomonadota bacterium]|nr:preprotein translocase subunit SecA [Pseudomonadota bacterium]
AGALADAGRAVLIGTGSVAESEQVAALLRQQGRAPLVLHALQGALEHEVIARAGRPGRITVATQMAGRGTDIALDEDVRARGGLHVLVCADDFGARAWRQLVGRCARQGDPGSAETLLCSAEGVLFRRLPRRLVATLVGRPAGSRLTAAVWRCAMWLDEFDGLRARQALQRLERRQAGRLAWSGPEE